MKDDRGGCRSEAVARPRILHMVDSLEVGGTERALCQLIAATQSAFAHAVCCVRQSGPFAQAISAAQVPILVVGKRDGHDCGLVIRLARVCRRLRPHIVHTHGWGCVDGIVGARLARVPAVIHTEHGRDVDDLSGDRRVRRVVRRLLGYAIDRYVTVSDDLARWLVDDVGVRGHRITVLPNGVDPERLHPSADRATLRRRFGYAEAEYVVGSVGRVEPVKDHTTLLDAFAAVVTVCPKARLLIVGEGSERARLELRARDRGLSETVRFLGHRDDVADCLAAMDVLAHPSLMEGTSNAVLEAMCLGLPVVATSAGGNAEIVADGVTGRLVDCRDRQALADVLVHYYERPELRSQHGRAGYERARQCYSAEQMILGYSNLYRELLRRHAASSAMPTG